MTELDIDPRGDGHNRNSLRLPNGSRIVGVSGGRAKVRALSRIALLLIDEAAEVTEAGYRTLRPMMAAADGGSMWMMSTPAGKRGFFHEAWVNGGPVWTRITVPATECPPISKEFLEEERQALGDRWVRQEYLCEFVDTSDSYFDAGDIRACIRGDVPELWGEIDR